MTKAELKNLFNKAHQLAKAINNKVGNYHIAFSIALKNLWSLKKKFNKKVITWRQVLKASVYLTTPKAVKNICGVPAWFINKNLQEEERYAITEAYGANIKRETAKAVLISFDTPYGYINLWTPKSIIVKQEEEYVIIKILHN